MSKKRNRKKELKHLVKQNAKRVSSANETLSNKNTTSRTRSSQKQSVKKSPRSKFELQQQFVTINYDLVNGSDYLNKLLEKTKNLISKIDEITSPNYIISQKYKIFNNILATTGVYDEFPRVVVPDLWGYETETQKLYSGLLECFEYAGMQGTFRDKKYLANLQEASIYGNYDHKTQKYYDFEPAERLTIKDIEDKVYHYVNLAIAGSTTVDIMTAAFKSYWRDWEEDYFYASEQWHIARAKTVNKPASTNSPDTPAMKGIETFSRNEL